MNMREESFPAKRKREEMENTEPKRKLQEILEQLRYQLWEMGYPVDLSLHFRDDTVVIDVQRVKMRAEDNATVGSRAGIKLN
ncbi:MAG: hypothetical protein NUW01_10355 [Gemmatimonadaceae bacterium]|nr:hypothetical protein [Gemmatimonadaceae bacterium]